MGQSSSAITVAVMHASGRTGKRLCQRLLAQGHVVKALGRQPTGLRELRDAGAQLCIGDPQDSRFLTEAFVGAEVAYLLMPYDILQPDYLLRQRALGEAMASAVRASGVPRVVLLSSLGAELSHGTGMILSLHEQEQRLADIPWLHAIFLRAGDFMENRLAALSPMLAYRSWSEVLDPDRQVPMVATADIADAAFHRISTLGWIGLEVLEVLGPRDMSYAEVTQVLAARLHLPDLRYERCSAPAMCATLIAAGLPPDTAELTVQISQAIEDGRIRSRAGRSVANSTPTTFADFAQGIVLPTAAG